jgi:hypothetical protein
MNRRSGILLASLLLLAIAAVIVSPGGSFLTAMMPDRKTGGDSGNAFVMNENEKKIMKEIGKVNYITDVLFDEAPDGKMIVSATAEIGTSGEPDKLKLARQIAHQYTAAVYGAGIPVAEASIHITSDNHLLLGTSLGSDHQKKMAQSVMSGSDANTAEFLRFLKENETQTSDPEKNTWMYEIP